MFKSTAAIEAVIHLNLAELIDLGKTCTWSEEEKEYLGIASAPYTPLIAPYV